MVKLNSFFMLQKPFILIAILLLYIIARLIILSGNRKWRSNPLHEAAMFLLMSTVVWIASMTVFPPWDSFGVHKLNAELFKVVRISFRDWRYNHSIQYFFINFLGNIVVFIPIGFLLPLTLRITLPRSVFCGFAMSLCIEIIQYPLGRWSDIDDLWLNTLGAALGALIYFAYHTAVPNFTAKFKINTTNRHG